MKEKECKFDPYDAIVNMKWAPSSGEIKMEPIPAGSKVPVITRGHFITDNQGRPLVQKPEDTQAFCNLLNHVWEIMVIPEMEERKEKNLPIPYPLNSFVSIFDAKNNKKIFKFNKECHFVAQAKLKQNVSINKGDPIHFDQICDVVNAELPTINRLPVSYLIFRRINKQISIYFDLRPNNPDFFMDEWTDEDKRWLANAYLETMLAQYFGHLSIIIPNLAKHGIPFTIGPRSEVLKTLCNLVENVRDQEEFEKKLSSVLTIKDVELLIQNWLELDVFKSRKNILNDVLKSYKRGIHSGVITILMSQVEGIITDELVRNDKGLNHGGRLNSWFKRIDEFEKHVIDKNIEALTYRILNGLIYFVKQSNLYENFTSWNGIDGMNRHASLHGKDVSFNTRANSIRMILLFDALHWIFFAMYDPRNKN